MAAFAKKRLKTFDTNIQKKIDSLNLPAEYKPGVENLISELIDQVYVDDSTGLFRPNYFEQCLINFLATKRIQGYCAVVFGDLTRFKNINDTFGHKAGDRVLRVVADILSSNIRSQRGDLKDVHARYGGDEFISLFIGVKEVHSVFEICQRIMNAVESYDWDAFLGTQGVKLHIDLGAVCFKSNRGLKHRRDHAIGLAEQLIRLADKEMYLSKHLNKRAHIISGPSIRRVRFNHHEVIPVYDKVP